ncbi:MAG TPA: AsnC family protein, partial [Paracoccus sp. (in: a-proteobacteria)]|nr:AsnC family protein [Paracoccus sp. (in: a-proteobacteria)]
MTRNRQTLPEDALDETDRAILNTLQEGFPLTPRPFDDAGAELGLTGAELIARIARLR